MVADIEESEEMDASELYASRGWNSQNLLERTAFENIHLNPRIVRNEEEEQ